VLILRLKTRVLGQTFSFGSVKEVLAKANEEKSGDTLAGISAASTLERVAAKEVAANLLLSDLRNHPIVDYNADEVTRVIQDGVNEVAYNRVKSWSVGEFREWLLSYETSDTEISKVRHGLTSEMIAAVTKLMSNLDLVYTAAKMSVPAHCNTTIGQPGTLAVRLQPNHTTDNLEGVTASVFEGLSFGVGDALIGLNPVNDSVANTEGILHLLSDIKHEFDIPTQICVLAHITTQIEAVKNGAPTDLIFQSIAGSEKGNEAFGFSAQTIVEAQELLRVKGCSSGPNVMYFETGQGSELSSESHYDADQLTMEARCYGFAKHFNPFVVNTVVGFIGPEYLYDSRQVIRAGLEDHFMGKLTGIPMGCDCCYTNHMAANQNDLENLSLLLAAAGCNYLIGVPASDDIMLNYQTNTYHDGAAIREVLGLKPIKEFEVWLGRMGIMENGKLTPQAGDPTIFTKKGR